MENKTFWIALMATSAGMILYKRRKQLKGADPAFREGYFAGFLTPGPFTILALTGAAFYVF